MSATDDRSLEIRVGAFTLLALAGAFGVFWLLRGAVGGGLGGLSLSVDFAETSGLSDGAPVRLAGVVVGRIEQIELLPSRRDARGDPLPVRVHARLRPVVQSALTEGTRFDVASNSPLGEPFLEVVPGPPNAQPLADHAELRGEDPPRLDRLVAHLARVFDHMADETSQDPNRVGSLLKHLDAFLDDSDQMLRAVHPGVVQALQHADELAVDARGFAVDARALVAEARPLLADLRRDQPALTAHLQSIAAKLDAFSSKLDPADVATMRATFKDAQAAAARLGTLVDRSDKILAAIEHGDGTVGKAINDPKLFEDLKEMVADLKAHPWKVLWKN